MYTPSWLSDQSLITSLLQEPWRWQAAQALRVVGHIPRIVPPRGTIQKGVFPESVPWRFHCAPDYRYPCAELYRVFRTDSRTDSGWQLVSTQPALNGYYGTLPYVYQDLEKQMRLAGDHAGGHADGHADGNESMLGFFSIFSDRILKHTNQIKLDASLPVLFEQCKQKAGQKLTPGHRLLALAGVPSPKTIPVNNLVRYAAAVGRKTTNLKLLALILRDYFSLDFRLESPPLMKMPVAPDCRTQLHSHVDHRTACAGRLGESCLLGNSCYLLHTCVFVGIVVNTGEEYQALTGDPLLAPAILEMCSIYFSSLVRFRLQINCPRRCLASPQLSAQPAAKPAGHIACLGRLSCLLSGLHPEQRITVDFPGTQASKGRDWPF